MKKETIKRLTLSGRVKNGLGPLWGGAIWRGLIQLQAKVGAPDEDGVA